MENYKKILISVLFFSLVFFWGILKIHFGSINDVLAINKCTTQAGCHSSTSGLHDFHTTDDYCCNDLPFCIECNDGFHWVESEHDCSDVSCEPNAYTDCYLNGDVWEVWSYDSCDVGHSIESCGSDEVVDKYCDGPGNKDVYEHIKKHTCNSGACVENLESQYVKTCSEDCQNGVCVDNACVENCSTSGIGPGCQMSLDKATIIGGECCDGKSCYQCNPNTSWNGSYCEDDACNITCFSDIGCRSVTPPNAQVVSGDCCGTGSCVACKPGTYWDGNSCEPNCTPSCFTGPGCRTSLTNGQITSGTCCDGGSCYTCRSGYTWDGNSCEPNCTNECSFSGQTKCENRKKYTCGNYDADSCLEWDSGTSVECCSNSDCPSSGYGANICRWWASPHDIIHTYTTISCNADNNCLYQGSPSETVDSCQYGCTQGSTECNDPPACTVTNDCASLKCNSNKLYCVDNCGGETLKTDCSGLANTNVTGTPLCDGGYWGDGSCGTDRVYNSQYCRYNRYDGLCSVNHCSTKLTEYGKLATQTLCWSSQTCKINKNVGTDGSTGATGVWDVSQCW